MSIQAQKTSPQPSRMKLASVTRGRLERPTRVLLYGVEGVGKSTFAASAPSPVFIAAEDGTSQLDVARFPEPKTWSDVLEAIGELAETEHQFKTLVIDTLDWLEPLCWAHVCEQGKWSSIEDAGFGKGYVAALDAWRVLLARLEQLRSKRGMHVVFLAHSWIKPFKNPEGEDYDRYELKLHAKAGGLLKEWADCVLFTRHETFADKDGKTKRVRGVSTGARVIHTNRTAAYDAKNRYSLPDTLPLEWDAFAAAVLAAVPVDATVSKNRIDELLKSADPELSHKVLGAVREANGNAAQLARIADRLAARINIAGQQGGAQ